MADSNKPVNPFYTVIQIPDEYFCDRKKETDDIIRLLLNGNNIVLKAQRRIGKSSLIQHIFNQEPINSDYNVLYVDIFGTKNLEDFQMELQNKLLNAPFARAARIRKEFEMLTKGINITLGEYNTVTGNVSLPRIGTTPSQLPRIPLEEVFNFLEKTSKPNIVVFDEFQQIQYYPERMAAILRSFTQKMNNTKFIFSGSSSHMLTVLFEMSSQPFYKSAESFEIKALELDTYKEFCNRLFAEYGKEINGESVEFLYELFSGETAPMQQVMNRVFTMVDYEKKADTETIIGAVNDILDSKDTTYREIMNRIEREQTRNTLFCIAALGIAMNLTSSKVMKNYRLDNASSVQKSLLSLQDEKSPLIRKIAKGTYVIEDRMLELWIAREGNYLDLKFDLVKDRYFLQKAIENPSYNPIKPQ